MTRDQAIEKVRALLKLAAGTDHPEEAKTARAVAAKLADEHNIREADLVESPRQKAVTIMDLMSLIVQFMTSEMNFIIIEEPDGNNTTKKQC